MNIAKRSVPVACLLATFLLLAAPGLPAAAEQVSLSGRIFQPDGATPYANAIVRIISQETGETLSSAPTDPAGRYEFENLPPGTYTFEVEVPEGIYRLDRSVVLGENDSASISFTVKPEDDDREAGAPPRGEGMSPRRKGTLIALIAGGAALILVAVDDDDDDDEASPFQPGN